MAISDLKIEGYDQIATGYRRVLSLQVNEVPLELGGSNQVVQIELLKADCQSKIAVHFESVAGLEIASLHPGTTCLLQIHSVVDAQLEGIRYRVFNGEQDFA